MSLLDLRDVGVRRGGRELLSGVSLEVNPGDLLAILGPNGVGKSTLWRLMAGLVPPSAGHVRLGTEPTGALSPRERAARVAWLPQERSSDSAQTVEEFVATARFRFGESTSVAIEHCARAFGQADVTGLRARRCGTLSGGERQRVAVAALLAQETDLLLLDEPANHLDPSYQRTIYELIAKLWRAGHGVGCVTHDVNLLAHLGDADRLRVIGLGAGGVRFQTTFSDESLPEKLSALFDTRIIALRDGRARYLVPAIGESAPREPS